LKIRGLMIAKTHNEKRFARQFSLKPAKEALIILGARGRAAQIFVDFRRVAGRRKSGVQIGRNSSVHGEMIGG